MKKLLLIIIAILFLGTLGYFSISNMTYSSGSRAGYLIKISQKGYIFKTYEGQLNLGGISSGGGDDLGAIGRNHIWAFSVEDEAVYKELQKYEGRRVSLAYRQVYKNFFWQGDTDYFIQEVEVIE